MTELTESLTSVDESVAQRVITALAGPEASLREDQWEAIRALRRPGARVLVVQATGWGKSAVYWAATAIGRAAGAGPTLVVSPLLSLMRDQVLAAERAGLRAASVNSANVDDWQQVEGRLLAGELDVLLVSPERLANPAFGRRVLEALAGRLGLLVVDEAHAVSDWGHDFRPDYRRVADLLRELNPATPVLATTATANARVTQDVADQLSEEATVLRGPLGRRSLQLAVVPSMHPVERYAWVVDHLPSLPGSGVVYTLTVADAERLTEVLREVHGQSCRVAAYTGGLDPDERVRLEEELRRNEVKALVATSALGMGYDKPDLGFVVHLGSPPTPVAYYQQVGRAGRAIDHALVTLLPSGADEGVWDHFATATIPDPDQVARLLTALQGYAESSPASVPSLEAETGLRRGRVELMLKQLAVDRVVQRVDGGWLATGQPWSYPHKHYEGIVATRRREAAIMRDYTRGARCLMQLLQESLDDEGAEPCGRCSVCLGRLPDGLAERPQTETVRRVTEALRDGDHLLDPRKMWPGGAFGARGRIPAGELADPGRVLVLRDAPEWRELVRRLDAADLEAPPDLLEAGVRTLSRWRREWAARPEVVVGLPAAGRPRLVVSLADHLATVGRLDRASLSVTGAVPGPDLGSGAEAAQWREVVHLDDPVSVAGRCVLLVVDASSTLWPVTVGAALLRRAGAARVLPLLVHRRP
ncbi:MAG TPA: DEAD/DEAH box helicase [Segeticoccus sp.]|uniref:RecQ family ATP-dependent DNA helicase n=1 Tax=Segeticoccus sp. TaxID=2706531 RepID=UPI002D802DF0|nr:DEAD/DEAH box helicase [Segeticoccus sp.]HET8598911.1 DEAD/DEAH box helicase [Segeticoccus sp.]